MTLLTFHEIILKKNHYVYLLLLIKLYSCSLFYQFTLFFSTFGSIFLACNRPIDKLCIPQTCMVFYRLQTNQVIDKVRINKTWEHKKIGNKMFSSCPLRGLNTFILTVESLQSWFSFSQLCFDIATLPSDINYRL